MENMFYNYMAMKVKMQSLAGFFQNDFGDIPIPEYAINEFEEQINKAIAELQELKEEGLKILKGGR